MPYELGALVRAARDQDHAAIAEGLAATRLQERGEKRRGLVEELERDLVGGRRRRGARGLRARA